MHKIYMGISYKGRSVVASTVVIFIIEFNIKKGYSLALKNNKLVKMTKSVWEKTNSQTGKKNDDFLMDFIVLFLYFKCLP